MSRSNRMLTLAIGFAVMAPAYGIQAPLSLDKRPVPKVVELNSKGAGYLRLLGGPPETVTMRSGLVVLAPGKSVGKHNTENYEEVVIILEGRAEMKITGGETLKLPPGYAAYCPPHTDHDVLNAGDETLKYVYVVAAVPNP